MQVLLCKDRAAVLRFALLSWVAGCSSTLPTEPLAQQPSTDAYAVDHTALVALNAAPCALDVDGDLHCWSGPGSEFPKRTSGPFVDVASFLGGVDHGLIRALRVDGSTEMIWCRSLTTTGCQSLGGPFVELLGPLTGRRDDNTIVGDVGDHTETVWRLWSTDGPVAALSEDGRLVRGYFVDEPIPSPEDVVEVAAARRSACVLRTSGGVECIGPDPVGLPGTYATIRGGAHGLCGLREDGRTVDCSDGRTIDFGAPVRLFSTGSVAEAIGVCVVTEDGRIQCHDPFGYYADFQGELR